MHFVSSSQEANFQATHGSFVDDPCSQGETIPLTSPPSKPTTPTSDPSFMLIFSHLSRSQVLRFLVPAVLVSLVAGGVAPFMTYVVGQAFEVFAVFSRTPPTQATKSQLIRGISLVSLELVALAVAALALGVLTSYLWICCGEHNIKALRLRLYDDISKKEIAWFDDTSDSTGGLTSKLTGEIEDVHKASSLAAGMFLQHVTTFVICIILAFIQSWLLTIIILASLPVLIILQGISQAKARPLLEKFHSSSATAASMIGDACEGISTVKAFNAAPHELSILSAALHQLQSADSSLNKLWGSVSAISQFITMAMFAQAFWFGAKIVRDGKATAGSVMTAFWACFIATNNLQLCVPHLAALIKGKLSVASLMALVDHPNERHVQLRKISPDHCNGELSMQNISFAYPSRPSIPVLLNVTLFFPAQELTFIVGDSGSGKSTLAHLLLGFYPPQDGTILLDDRDIMYLDRSFLQTNIACVSQSCLLFDMSVYDNVAIAARGKAVGRDEVVKACQAALLHEFVMGLENGYDTLLGVGGKALSGGQMQQLAIARALLYNPSVLLLDEPTASLDITSRFLVFEAIKRWRKGKTTIVITHDVSANMIGAGDFVYVMKFGTVTQQGYRADLEQMDGEFKKMVDLQQRNAFSSPPAISQIDPPTSPEKTDEDVVQQLSRLPSAMLRPRSWAVDLLADLGKPAPPAYSRISGNTTSLEPISPFPRLSQADTNANKLLEKSALEVARKRTANSKWLASHALNPAMRHLPTAIKSRKLRKRRVALDHLKGHSISQLAKDVLASLPSKILVFLGLIFALLSGAMTPLFSFVLSLLLFEISTGGKNVTTINILGLILLGVAAGDGLLIGLKYLSLETASMGWANSLRKKAFRRILLQDKKWFDSISHSPQRMVQVLIQDGDDARGLISDVLGQFFVVVAMLGVGLIWAMILGWQLTLAGLAFAPVFMVAIAIQTRLVDKSELRNKHAKEEVSRVFNEAISSIRAIRAMHLHLALQRQFVKSINHALGTGLRNALVVGCTYGIGNALIYIAEALLFYIGATLLARDLYTYLQMIQVLNLVVFSVTIASQLMAFTQKVTRSRLAAQELLSLSKLSESTDESFGMLYNGFSSSIYLDGVNFSYPQRADISVLRNLTMNFVDGESVAIVGPSGSGKSTILSLLQRLYHPAAGTIRVGEDRVNLNDMSVAYLRSQIAVVSQHAHLLDSTIRDNIAYGRDNVSLTDIQYAAKMANIHDFICSLPHGYETRIGNHASLLSGGQAQRLQIARALVKPSKLLLLDECTSALDPTNQTTVLEAIRRAQVGRTTIMVTHSLNVMQLCDRIVVLNGGRVVEEGSYAELVKKNGFFTQFIHSGEWGGLL